MTLFTWQFFAGLAVGAVGMALAPLAFERAVEWWLRNPRRSRPGTGR